MKKGLILIFAAAALAGCNKQEGVRTEYGTATNEQGNASKMYSMATNEAAGAAAIITNALSTNMPLMSPSTNGTSSGGQ